MHRSGEKYSFSLHELRFVSSWVFLDARKAFELVNHDLFQRLIDCGLPSPIIRFLLVILVSGSEKECSLE